MAFPLLLFVIALAATVGPRLNAITFGRIFPPGVVTLVLIFSIFGWFYPARIMRAQVLSIREKEYVEAARMIGASDARIIRSHVLPHLIAPMIVYSTLIVASYVLFEAGLSFLGVGIPHRRPELGQPPLDRARVLHDAAAAHGLARPGRAADDAGVQPARATASGMRSIRVPRSLSRRVARSRELTKLRARRLMLWTGRGPSRVGAALARVHGKEKSCTDGSGSRLRCS